MSKTMTMTRRTLLGGSAAAATLALAACNGTDNADGSSEGGSAEKELTLYAAVSPATLDPQNDSNSDDSEITGLIGEGLFRYGADGTTPEPAVCSSYTVSDDGLTYTFTLGDSLWQDGTAVTAADFVYGLQRLFSPELASENANSYLSYIQGAAAIYNGEADPTTLGVSAPDDKTLVVTLASVLPSVTVEAFFTAAHTYPMNQTAIEEGGDGWSTDPAHHLSNGPYILSEYNADSSVVLVRNDAYAGSGPAEADKITFRFYSDSSAADVAMANGELDYYKYATDALIAQMGDSVDVVNAEMLATACLFLNWRCAPLDDVRVREAIYLAIDAAYTNDTLESGYGVIARGVVGDKFSDPAGGSFRTDSNSLVDDYSDDQLARAQELLAEAGYPNGEGLPTLVYLTSNSTKGNQRAEFFQALLKDTLGIEVEVGSYDTPTYLSMIGGSDYAFSYMSMNTTCDNAVEMLANFTTDADMFGISIPEYDQLFAQLQTEPDPATQSELMHQAESVLLRDNFALRPIVYGYAISMFGSEVDPDSVTVDPTALTIHSYLKKTTW